MASLEKEIMQIPVSRERWENWMQFTSGQQMKKFTQFGFEVIQTPPEVHKKLLNAVNKGLENWENIPFEREVDAIYSKELPKFLNINSLAFEVMDDMREIHEKWAGDIKLTPTSAYGVRFYQNGSSLVMHHDKVILFLIY